MKSKVLIASILLSLAGAASADGAYVGVGVLQGYADLPSYSGTISGSSVTLSGDKDTSTGFKLFAGYNFTPNWGVEAGYNDLGNSYSFKGTVNGTPFTSNDIKAHNYYVAVTGTLPLNNQFSLLGKLGWVRNTADLSNVCASGSCVSISSSSSRNQLLYGVGMSYAFTPNWAAQLEYENYGKMTEDEAGMDTPKASSVALSVKYVF